MSAPDVILHIGMQQSGATMVQRALSRLRPQLRRHGVAYVGHAQLTDLDHVAGWDCRADADRERAAAFEWELNEVVDQERRKVVAAGGEPPVTVLLSSDHLVGSGNIGECDADVFRPQAVPAVTQVVRALDAKRVRLVLYVHRQDRLMEFCYLREVQKGRHHRFAEQFPRRFEPILDYVELLGRLREVPAVADVHVRPFELIDAHPAAFVDDFLGCAGLRGALDLDVLGTGLAPHRVYSRRGLKIALAMNPHVDTNKDQKLVRDFVLENFSAADDEHSRFLSNKARLRILEAYAEQNRQLFRTYLPDLPEGSYDDDAATARLGTMLPPRAPSDNAAAVPQPRVGGLAGALPLFVRGGGGRGHAAAAAAGRRIRRAEASVKHTASRAADRVPLLYGLRVRYLARRCDVFLVSFPKCGRTWLRVMVGLALGERFGIRVRNLRRFTNAEVHHPGVPRVLATHDDSPQMKPVSQVMRDKRGYRNARVILLVRDPRDVVVSLYFHVTHRRGRRYDGSLSDFVRDPVGSLASLLAFYDAWAAQLTVPKDVLLVRYEDLHDDPVRELRRVLGFLGVGQVSDATVARAVDGASFERLRRAEREGTAATRALRTANVADPESYKVRRGKVGGYVDYLDTADINHVADLVESSRGARELGYAGIDADRRMDSV